VRAQHHTDRCRKRIEDELRKTPEGRARLEQAELRIVTSMAEALEEGDRKRKEEEEKKATARSEEEEKGRQAEGGDVEMDEAAAAGEKRKAESGEGRENVRSVARREQPEEERRAELALPPHDGGCGPHEGQAEGSSSSQQKLSFNQKDIDEFFKKGGDREDAAMEGASEETKEEEPPLQMETDWIEIAEDRMPVRLVRGRSAEEAILNLAEDDWDFAEEEQRTLAWGAVKRLQPGMIIGFEKGGKEESREEAESSLGRRATHAEFLHQLYEHQRIKKKCYLHMCEKGSQSMGLRCVKRLQNMPETVNLAIGGSYATTNCEEMIGILKEGKEAEAAQVAAKAMKERKEENKSVQEVVRRRRGDAARAQQRGGGRSRDVPSLGMGRCEGRCFEPGESEAGKEAGDGVHQEQEGV
jgi:hypothetical protein